MSTLISLPSKSISLIFYFETHSLKDILSYGSNAAAAHPAATAAAYNNLKLTMLTPDLDIVIGAGIVLL